MNIGKSSRQLTFKKNHRTGIKKKRKCFKQIKGTYGLLSEIRNLCMSNGIQNRGKLNGST